MTNPLSNDLHFQQIARSSYTTRVRLPVSSSRRPQQQRSTDSTSNTTAIQEIDVHLPLRRFNDPSIERFNRALHRIQNIQQSFQNSGNLQLDDSDVPPLVQQQQPTSSSHNMRFAPSRSSSQQTSNMGSTGTSASSNTIAPEPTIAHIKPVFELTCRHCLTLVCSRGMKAILLADTSIELYSTDCPAASVHILEKDYLTRSCHCRIRDVACLQCGNVVGYHVISPCSRCLDASNNGHFWMFHTNACQPAQRHDRNKRVVVWNNLPRAELDQDFLRGNKYSYEQLCR